MEVSSVSVPADQSRLVGVGRSANLKKGIIMTEEKKQDINLDEVRSQTLEEAKAEFKRNSKEILRKVLESFKLRATRMHSLHLQLHLDILVPCPEWQEHNKLKCN